MTSNSTTPNSSSGCDYTPEEERFRYDVYVAAYFVTVPVSLISGLTTQILCARAFVQHARKESGYVYAAFWSFSSMARVVSLFLYAVFFQWFAGVNGPGPAWFTGNLALMWTAAHLVTPLVNAAMTMFLLMSACMTADRVYAMAAPFSYKNAGHRRLQLMAFGLSLTLSVGTSLVDGPRYWVDQSADGYVIVADDEFISGQLASWLNQLRNALTAVATLLLIGCGIAVIVFYRKRARNGAKLGANTDKKRRNAEKTLIFQTICQSATTSVNNGAMMAFYVLAYAEPQFAMCHGQLMLSFLAIFTELLYSMDFYIMLISKNFRSLIVTSMPQFSQSSVVYAY